jgi:hypothetical protein
MDCEMGTPRKPLKLMSIKDYPEWKDRFHLYVVYSDTSMWVPIMEVYTRPTYVLLAETVVKPISKRHGVGIRTRDPCYQILAS